MILKEIHRQLLCAFCIFHFWSTTDHHRPVWCSCPRHVGWGSPAHVTITSEEALDLQHARVLSWVITAYLQKGLLHLIVMDPSDAVEVWYCSYVLSWATIKQSLHLPCNCVNRKKSIFKLFQNPPLAKSLVQATGSCPWQELCLCQVAKLLRALAGNCRLLRPVVKIFRLMDFSALNE